MTAEKFTRFEPADHLADIDDVAYLQIAVEESAEGPSAVPCALGG